MNASRLPVCALPLLLAAAVIAAGPAVPLFDGKSFAGWEGDTNRTFRLEAGAIVGGSLATNVPRNEFLCTTRPYTNFVLRLKFKVLGEGVNAGIQIRSQRIPHDAEMIGYQADLGEPGWWGCLYDESRRRVALAKSDMAKLGPALKRGDWNEYEIRGEGPRIRLAINGVATVDYSEPDPAIPQQGYIGLQIHGGPPSEAWYKDLSLEELP
jgi:hypothetical protein